MKKKKKQHRTQSKILVPVAVLAVVVGSFFVNWNHVGYSPISYYDMGIAPTETNCEVEPDSDVKAEEKKLVQEKKVDAIKAKYQ